MVAHRRTRAATAAVGQQRHVGAGLQSADPRVCREHAELHKMIPAPARAEQRPCAVLVLLRDRASPERKERLLRMANNTRFLLLPWVSRVLGQTQGRSRQDRDPQLQVPVTDV